MSIKRNINSAIMSKYSLPLLSSHSGALKSWKYGGLPVHLPLALYGRAVYAKTMLGYFIFAENMARTLYGL